MAARSPEPRGAVALTTRRPCSPIVRRVLTKALTTAQILALPRNAEGLDTYGDQAFQLVAGAGFEPATFGL